MKLPQGRPALMGILNVTPDSFSDGGLYFHTEAAIEAAKRMVEEGADIIDVGGESTRPGAEPVPADEELGRVIPVIQALAAHGVRVSIDTMKPEVAREALAVGASILNDVTGLRNPEMVRVAAGAGAVVCIMHMQGEPRTMQASPHYEDVVDEVLDYLLHKAREAESAGIDRGRIWIDPGIGFGKNLHHNLLLLRNLERFTATAYPVLVGVSRKSFLGRILGTPENPLPPNERLEGTLAAQTLAQSKGARIIRAHDVKASRRAIDVAAAVLG